MMKIWFPAIVAFCSFTLWSTESFLVPTPKKPMEYGMSLKSVKTSHEKLESLWKTGKFTTYYSPTKEMVELLRITPQSLVVYYDSQRQQIRIRKIQGLCQENQNWMSWDFPCEFPIYDLDATQVKHYQLRIVASYYHRKEYRHGCFQMVLPLSIFERTTSSFTYLSQDKLLDTSLSPYQKVMVFHKNNVSMTCLMSFNGEIKTILQDVGNQTSPSVCITTKLDFPFSLVEKDSKYIYLMNMNNHELYGFCPWDILKEEKKEVQHSLIPFLSSSEIEKYIPEHHTISCFHVHSNFWNVGSEMMVLMGTLKGDIHVFHLTLKHECWKVHNHRVLSLPPTNFFPSLRRIHRIYGDDYKIIVLGEDHHLRIFSSLTGELWSTIPSITDSYRCSFMKATHQYLMVDGTKGIVLREIQQYPPRLPLDKQYKKSQGLPQSSSSDMIPPISPTLSPTLSNKSFSYINFLMSIPAYTLNKSNQSNQTNYIPTNVNEEDIENEENNGNNDEPCTNN